MNFLNGLWRSKYPIAVLLSSIFLNAPMSQATPGNCDGAKRDNNIWWTGIEHNSFDGTFRQPFGSVPTESAPIRLRIKTCAEDLTGATVFVWDSKLSKRIGITMNPEYSALDVELGPVQYWTATIPVPNHSDLLYYFFELRDGTDIDYYTDDDIRSFPGGQGTMRDSWNDLASFQITIFDKNFDVPEWVKGAIIYQIFPDRFRNGDSSNDPQTGEGWIYGLKPKLNAWNSPLCDPMSECLGQRYNQFYGGDLKGVEQSLDNLKKMGVTAVYLNPIFASPTNHKYDTTDFKKIDPAFGSLEDFESLVQAIKKRGMHIVLDGVFNHVSADSPYFDLWGRWNRDLELISPNGPGNNDASGACESSNSSWRDWFFIPAIGSPALGSDRRTKVLCPNPILPDSQAPFETYEAWFGFFNVPKLNSRLASVRNFFFQGGNEAVVPYWMNHGADAWRLDVGGDIDPGTIVDPSNHYWEDFRKVVKSKNPNAWIIGEEWGNPSSWLLGTEWDSVMNYRLRSSLLNWMFDRCYGYGCAGTKFYDNDSNDFSPVGPIFQTTDKQFVDQVQGIHEAFPDPAWHSAFNLLGSHDTNRILFLLQKISGGDRSIARKKFLFLMGFLMSYPGAPSIYYGDEVGVTAEGKWIEGAWNDDPYNRVPYPWAEQGMSPDLELRAAIESLGSLRANHAVLNRGDFKWLRVDELNRVLIYERTYRNQRAIVVLNRSNTSHDIDLGEFVSPGMRAYLEELYPKEGRLIRAEGPSFLIRDLGSFDFRIFYLKN